MSPEKTSRSAGNSPSYLRWFNQLPMDRFWMSEAELRKERAAEKPTKATPPKKLEFGKG